MDRHILHVDMDEFFAAVEKLDRPELRGRPLLVGGDPAARGVVSTASYEARRFGCHSAMPMARAVRLCPQAIVLPVRMRRYAAVSEQVFAIFDRFSPAVEPLSIDEAFLDVTGCRRLLGEAEHIAGEIRRAIRDELHLTASVGVAPNKFLAKVASDLNKPDGLTVITPGTIRATLDPLPIRKLWGVGPAAAERLAVLGVATIGDLRRLGPRLLHDRLGEAGDHLARLAEGRDDRPVTPDGQARSIGQEQTFATDVADLDLLRQILADQVDHVARRLRRGRLRARTVTLKLRYGDFTTLTRSATRPEPTDLSDDLRAMAQALLTAWARQSFAPLRLLGATASGLSAAAGRQLELFADPARQKARRVDEALDAIQARFGKDSVRRGR
ncbi:MAG: DNA polymerase IV [Planctomycetes bacterium]|nr:DNA polymerase IV [Planctomycetota bacterium]